MDSTRAASQTKKVTFQINESQDNEKPLEEKERVKQKISFLAHLQPVQADGKLLSQFLGLKGPKVIVEVSGDNARENRA